MNNYAISDIIVFCRIGNNSVGRGAYLIALSVELDDIPNYLSVKLFQGKGNILCISSVNKRVVNRWNDLPAEVAGAPSLHSFKMR